MQIIDASKARCSRSFREDSEANRGGRRNIELSTKGFDTEMLQHPAGKQLEHKAPEQKQEEKFEKERRSTE